MDNKDKRTKTMGREHGQEWTRKEKIEQHAHDIVVAGLAIVYITTDAVNGTPEHRMRMAARSILFHVDSILTGGEDE